MKFKKKLVMAKLLGIATGVLLGVVVVVGINVVKNNVDSKVTVDPDFALQAQLNEQVTSNLYTLIDEPLKASAIEIDTDSLETNSAGQVIVDGDVLIDGILARTIPIGEWGDEDFYTNQVQRCARKIYLLKPLNELMTPMSSVNKPTTSEEMKQALNIWINNPQYLDNDINNQMYLDELTTTVQVLLGVYLDMWNLSEITLYPNENLKAFEGNEVDYSFSIEIDENTKYLVGVKLETTKDEILLDKIYVTK